ERSARTSGGRFGRLFGGGFVSSAGSLIRTAGWFGVGISAVNGIMSAFRYDSVRAGIQDFASSIYFGLIDSFEESTKKRMREALQEVNEDIRNNVRNALDYGTELAPPRMHSAGARGPATQIDRRQDTSYTRFTDELKKLEPELGAIFERI